MIFFGHNSCLGFPVVLGIDDYLFLFIFNGNVGLHLRKDLDSQRFNPGFSVGREFLQINLQKLPFRITIFLKNILQLRNGKLVHAFKKLFGTIIVFLEIFGQVDDVRILCLHDHLRNWFRLSF
jgi:hypothetical protein